MEQMSMSGTATNLSPMNMEVSAQVAESPRLSAGLRILQLLIMREAFKPEAALTLCEISNGASVPIGEVEKHLRTLPVGSFAVLPVVSDAMFESWQSYYVEQDANAIAEAADRMRARATALDSQAEYLGIVADAAKYDTPVWDSGSTPVKG